MCCDRALLALILVAVGCTSPDKSPTTAPTTATIPAATPTTTRPTPSPTQVRTTVSADDIVDIGRIGPLRVEMPADELPRVLGAALSREFQSTVADYGCSLRTTDSRKEVADITLLLYGARRRVAAMFAGDRGIAFGVRRGDSLRHVLALFKRTSLSTEVGPYPYGGDPDGSVLIATRAASPRSDSPALAIYFENRRVTHAAAGLAGWMSIPPEMQVESCRDEP
jgi:hypothetical protein